MVKAADHVEEGGFSGAVWSDHRDDLTPVHLHAHVANGLHAAEIFGNAAHIKVAFCGHAHPFRAGRSHGGLEENATRIRIRSRMATAKALM